MQRFKEHHPTWSRRQLLHTLAGSVFAGLAVPGTADPTSAAFGRLPQNSVESQLPKVSVHSVRRAFHNGEHNAFTDLCRFRGQLYLTFRSCPDGHMVHPTASVIVLRSTDGLIWRKRSEFQKTAGDETAFLFEPDGQILAVGRHGGGREAQLLRSSPPCVEWDRSSLDRPIGGPLLTKWGDRYVVGGRKSTASRGPKTSLCWLHDDQLTEFAELPSGGDNSYPGFVLLTADTALVSWYSSHERDASGKVITAIYLAELRLEI